MFILISFNFKNKNRNFQTIACKLLQLCAESDTIKAQQMLQSKINDFGETTPIQLAVAGQSLEFVGHNCFQNLIIKKWYKKISPISSRLNVS